ncbi:carbohydrate porin [Ancylobacter lacus]|uniref:carbohydrate porin n=1 Tax=Ancylobacter lacus TaxID=2579970 RepID=UPI001BCC72CE|nr:carbohydrate porin [Ancylobacter lacus]MBS7537767.1 carbohydrate porin [Ancylobacter lacus]
MDRRWSGWAGALAALLALAPAPARPDDAAAATLTGDWGGARTALAARGVTLSGSWTGEVLANTRGGMRTGAVFDGLAEAQLDLDLGTLAGWNGARFHASGYWIEGRGLSAGYVGNLLTVSNIEAEAGWRLNELYLEQGLANGALSLRVGQIAADTEFWQSQTASLFINSSFGWPGLNAQDLPGGGPAYPLPTPGARLRWSPPGPWSVQVGLYNGNPLGGDGNANGLDFPLDQGLFAIAEASYAAPDNGGTWRVGAWYNSNAYDDLSTAADGLSLADPAAGAPATHVGNYALYAIADRPLWAGRLPNGASASLSGFVRVAVAPEADRSPLTLYADAGLALTGPLPGRPNDIAGLAVAWAKTSPALARLDRAANGYDGTDGPVEDYEAVLEITYQAAVTPWLTVQPFAQYVVHPGGNVPNPMGNDPAQAMADALVVGVRTGVVF